MILGHLFKDSGCFFLCHCAIKNIDQHKFCQLRQSLTFIGLHVRTPKKSFSCRLVYSDPLCPLGSKVESAVSKWNPPNGESKSSPRLTSHFSQQTDISLSSFHIVAYSQIDQHCFYHFKTTEPYSEQLRRPIKCLL